MDDERDRDLAAAAAAGILVLGATGRVGRYVVGELVRRLLLAAEDEEAAGITIYAATRDPSSGVYYTNGMIENKSFQINPNSTK